ncbi:MAG: zinc-binding dehydrogenase [Lentisphaerae bacterium]|nr:zinc-binding dehydrogenase [Lentisphaerota bacterium]
MKGLAAILVESNKPLVLEVIELPALTFGQALVKVLCSGICGAQINEIDAVKGPDRFLPHLLGHEATAEVLEAGRGVKTVSVGDRVVMHWRKGAGIEAPTPTYASRLGPINAGWVTTFNEYAVVSENRVTKVPVDFDPESGALLGCAVTTAFGVINNDAQLKVGESVAVFGAGGGVGLNIVQGAAMVSAHPIIAIDLFDNKLSLAAELGATHCINAARTDPEPEVLKIVGEAGVDVAVDNTGNVKVIEKAYRVTSARGRTILVGVPPKGKQASIYTLPLHFEKILRGSHGGDCRPEYDIPNYVRLCQTGKLNLKPLIGQRYALAQINAAIDAMRSGGVAGRCMIRMASEPRPRADELYGGRTSVSAAQGNVRLPKKPFALYRESSLCPGNR